MSTSAPARLFLAVVDGPDRADISVSPDALVGEVLRARGADPDRVLAVSSSGNVLDVDDPIGRHLGNGGVLWLVGGGTAGPATGRDTSTGRRPRQVRRRTPTGSAGWLACVAVTAACAVLVLIHSLSVGTGSGVLTDPFRYAVAALLAAGAVVLALRRSGDQGGTTVAGSHLVDETILGPILAFTAGFLLAPPDLYAALRLAVMIGMVAGASIASLRLAVSTYHQDASTAVASVLTTAWVSLAVLFGLALLLDVPIHVAPALILGAVPLMLRAMPSASIAVPDEQLLDLSFVARTATSVRGRAPRPPGRVQWQQVERSVRYAERRKAAGLGISSALVVLMAPPVLAAYEPGTITGWATLALFAFLVITLGLGPRSYRGVVEKSAPRFALLVLLVEIAWTARVAPDAGLWSLVVIGAGLGIALLTMAIVTGWRSVKWSRAGDVIEGIAIVFVMPAALLAAGVLEGMQTVAAG
ncbi:hypothetical protein EXU48_16530 [Occultella glacieicola]|uniref:EccD-like transmembrane domain-containing protein n=1 Tax=Occultella glacieicola TaxID=2518684 RepID=A0ABY2E1C7_9MICO|nr:hypothetical protein [Occultella glacieicola]TDE91727.1 hypothetical protein EXU48_16530 [Occultella glacieicola]